MKVASSDQNQKITETNEKAKASTDTVEVLYQKLGDKWYAFSIIGEEVFVGSIPVDQVHGDGVIPKKTA